MSENKLKRTELTLTGSNLSFLVNVESVIELALRALGSIKAGGAPIRAIYNRKFGQMRIDYHDKLDFR